MHRLVQHKEAKDGLWVGLMERLQMGLLQRLEKEYEWA